MIAYLFWHCAYPTTTVEQYEEALMRFQQRLGQQQPPGRRQCLISCCGLALARQSARIRGLVPARWLLGARSAQRFRCCWPGDECTRRRGRANGRGAWRALRPGLGRTRFAEAVDSSLADAAAGHSVADKSRRAATSGNDTMAAADGARTWQGVRSHRAARSQCLRTSRLVGAGYRARPRRCGR